MKAVGYLPASAATKTARDRLRAVAAARGLELGARQPESELRRALELARGEECAGLVVLELADLGCSARELAPVLGWIADSAVRLVSGDPPLDTADATGAGAVALLAEVGGWEAERANRLRERARAAGRPAGRPAVSDRPKLRARIEAMHAAGMSLHAIAERLNDDGVPTLRGGARWRASSVQTAAGYERPRPGRPPPPPPGPPRRPHKPRHGPR